MKYSIEEITTPRQAKEFLLLPVKLYHDDPNWVRPLDNDINNVFNPAKNPFFSHGECTRWLLRDEQGTCVGRVAAFIDHDACRLDSYAVGGMGFFECINDRQAAFTLFDCCRQWLQARGMDAMEGPENFGERSQWWGLLVDGFRQPVYQMPYTHPYYIPFFEQYGFRDYFRQYIYRTHLVLESLDRRMVLMSERLLRNKDYRILSYREMTPSQAKTAFLHVYNHAWNINVHGVGNMQMEQVETLFRALKPVLDPDLLYFAYYQDQPIGFFIMIPELNHIIRHLNGKLNWLGILKFLYYRRFRPSREALGLIFGVVEEFQNRGVQGAMIKRFCEIIIERKGSYDWLNMSWIGDFNPAMMHMMSYIGASISQTYVTYRCLFRDDIPFRRSIDKEKTNETTK